MASTTHIFRHLAGLEGWAGTPFDASTEMKHWPLHKGRFYFRNLGKVGGGTIGLLANMPRSILTMRRMGKATGGDNYWEWSGTWEDLGVTPGNVVSDCQGDYWYRWYLHGSHPSRACTSEWAAGYHKSGPFELRNSGGSLTGTFTATIDVPARGVSHGAALWNVSPVSANNHIDEAAMYGFGLRSGTVSALAQASNTSIKLRLHNFLNATDGNPQDCVRLKQARIALIITHAPALASGKHQFFFSH